jgi:hypothetical protein
MSEKVQSNSKVQVSFVPTSWKSAVPVFEGKPGSSTMSPFVIVALGSAP